MNNTLVKQSNIKIKFIPSYENVTIAEMDITEGIVSLLFRFNEVKIPLYAQCIVNKDNQLYRLY